MNQPTYEVAVIKDGKIIKVYPQAEYNQYIIDSYKQNQPISGLGGSLEMPKQIERLNTPVETKETIQAQQGVSDVVNAGVKPFKLFAGLFVLSVVFVIVGGVAYKIVKGKRPNVHLMQFILVLLLAGSFLIMLGMLWENQIKKPVKQPTRKVPKTKKK